MTKAEIYNDFKIEVMIAVEKAIQRLEALQENEVIIGELDLTETTEEAIDEDLAELEKRNVLFRQF